MTKSQNEARKELMNLICDRFDEHVAEVASDAILDILRDAPEEARKLLAPIAFTSDYWLEQLARAACDLPSEHLDDLERLLELCLAQPAEDVEGSNDWKEVTAFGQSILDAICDRLAEEGEEYTLLMIGKTNAVVTYCAAHLIKSVKSVAGGMSDLIEKDYVSNSWYVNSEEPSGHISLTQAAWLRWSGHDEERLAAATGMSSDEFVGYDEPPDKLEKDLWCSCTGELHS